MSLQKLPGFDFYIRKSRRKSGLVELDMQSNAAL